MTQTDGKGANRSDNRQMKTEMRLHVHIIEDLSGKKMKLAPKKTACLTHWAGSELHISRSVLLPGGNLLLAYPCRCPALPPRWTEASWPTRRSWLSAQQGTSPAWALRARAQGGADMGAGHTHISWFGAGQGPGARTLAVRTACHLLLKGGCRFLKISCSGWKHWLGSCSFLFYTGNVLMHCFFTPDPQSVS